MPDRAQPGVPAKRRRRLLGLWLIGAIVWLIGAGLLIHPEHFLRPPLYTWEDLRWQFADCQHLPSAPDASPADRMVPRVLCTRAQHSGLRKHLVFMLLPPALVLGLGWFAAWVARVCRAEA